MKTSNLHKRIPKLKDLAPDLHVPRFKSDAEELAWLDANHERLADLALRYGAPVRFIRREETQQISIRIPVIDLNAAKKIAERTKENYQAVLKRALRRGLIEESGPHSKTA